MIELRDFLYQNKIHHYVRFEEFVEISLMSHEYHRAEDCGLLNLVFLTDKNCFAIRNWFSELNQDRITVFVFPTKKLMFN